MKKLSKRFHKFIGVIILFMAFFAVCLPVSAEWICSHGSTARFYDESVIDTSNLLGPGVSFVWGLGYAQVPNATNWIIYSIPTTVPSTTRYIALQLETVEGGDLYVDRVAVWNRNIKIVPDIVVNWSGNVGIQVLDLGSEQPVESLSISIRTQTGDFGGKLKVFTVGAEFNK